MKLNKSDNLYYLKDRGLNEYGRGIIDSRKEIQQLLDDASFPYDLKISKCCYFCGCIAALLMALSPVVSSFYQQLRGVFYWAAFFFLILAGSSFVRLISVRNKRNPDTD